MSDEMISLIVTVAIIGLLFAWPPFLNFICPPCGRFLTQRRAEKQAIEKQVIEKGSTAAAVRH
jgi:cytochrome c oxidase assembly protein Cox11